MKYYDLIAPVYDGATEAFYRRARHLLAEAMDYGPADRILIPACGTGQVLPHIYRRAGREVEVVCVDYSEAMLRRARSRARRSGATRTRFVRADLRRVDAAFLARHGVPGPYDKILYELALSVIPAWRQVFDRSLEWLVPGGRVGVMDWYVSRPRWWGKLIDWMARSDTSRDIPGYVRKRLAEVEVPARLAGGYLWLITGRKGDRDDQQNRFGFSRLLTEVDFKFNAQIHHFDRM